MRKSLLAGVMLLWGCETPSTPDAGDVWAAPGSAGVGVARLTVAATDGGRALPVEVWYPADTSAVDFSVEDFEVGARRETLAGWLAMTPEACSPRRALGARDATPLAGARPLVVFSHCTECFRFSMHSLAARLASHGFVFAAVDHVDNTGFDATAPLNDAFLAVRADDVSRVITALVDGEGPVDIDAARVAAVGHSFGAVTTARVVETDARVKAGFLIAAPADSPFLNARHLPNVDRPLSWLLAMEDNSISFIGNNFIRDNFVKAPKPNWLIEVENAGHWSFSDIAGLGGKFMPGCGEGLRDPDGGVFTYVDNELARAIALRSVTAWAAFVLNGDEGAAEALSVAADGTHVRRR